MVIAGQFMLFTGSWSGVDCSAGIRRPSSRPADFHAGRYAVIGPALGPELSDLSQP
jgi:hypothetical protein